MGGIWRENVVLPDEPDTPKLDDYRIGDLCNYQISYW